MKYKQASGFTAIEIMVVLLIMAILAAIAYPSYQESIRKARRTEARAALTKMMQQQERYYSLHTSYVAFSADSIETNARRFKWFSGETPAASFYEIDAQACDGESVRDCIVLTARPGTGKVNASYRDPACGDFTLNSRGERSAVMARCWQ